MTEGDKQPQATQCPGGCGTGLVPPGYEFCPECQAGATILNREAIKKLRAERDQALAHDRQPYPTAEAYEKVCAALEKAKVEVKQLQPNQREHDLVRQQRMELLADNLITREEYATLASERGNVKRLEDYDALRAKLRVLETVAQEYLDFHDMLIGGPRHTEAQNKLRSLLPAREKS